MASRRSPRLWLIALLAVGVTTIGVAGTTGASADGSSPDTTVATDDSTGKTYESSEGSSPDTTVATDDSTGKTYDSGTTSDSTVNDAPTPADTVLGTGDFDVADLEWGACDPDDDVTAPMDCATVTVPLDYDDPAGETLDLALIRVPALGDSQGIILTNPGGPGGSGFDFVSNAGQVLVSEMGLDDYDLIGFDPRGVDRSGGLRCVDDAFLDEHLYLDTTPDTPEEEQLNDEADQLFIEGCRDAYGATLAEYSTENTARDMDLIRQAAGEAQISYLGISYGTYLGATYATMFPDQVRVMVLDSAYEPTGDSLLDQYQTQLVGFEGAFDNWAAWCEGTAEDCPFNAADVGNRWDVLRDGLDTKPLTAQDGREVNQSTLETATISALYSEAAWPDLAQSLLDAEEGDPAGILRLADDYEGRKPDGTFSTLSQSLPVINCASGLGRDVPDDPQALLEQLQQAAPRFSFGITVEDLAQDYCADLLGADVPAPALDYSGDAPILVVGGTDDPATPFRWAEELTAALGPSAGLLQFNGEGHGQVLSSTCVTDFEAAVIVDLQLPPTGTECDPDPDFVEPEWWADLPLPAGIEAAVELPSLSAGLGLNERQYWYEVHLTDLSSDEAVSAYRDALDGTDFNYGGQQEIFDGVPEGVWFAPNADVFVVIALSPQSFDENDDLAGLDAAVPDGKTVVVIATFELP